MATAQASASVSSITCRYYIHGACKLGSNCRFSHNLETSKSSQICKYYQIGGCSYGDRCRYDHVKADKKAIETATNRLTGTKSEPTTAGLRSWAEAKEFVPGQTWKPTSSSNGYIGGALTYLEILTGPDAGFTSPALLPPAAPGTELCPYAAMGECWYGENCVYLHGNVCDMCHRAVLHPEDSDQNEQHRQDCLVAIETDMKESFALALSEEQSCGICMEKVVDNQENRSKRFGILSNCKHCFCLQCLMRWRQSKNYKFEVKKSCPACRTRSDFIIPSKIWVEDDEEKTKLIGDYKSELSQKQCKYFKQGQGECPFNMHCFFKHAYPDGTLEERKPRPRRKRRTHDDSLEDMPSFALWDYIEERLVLSEDGLFDIGFGSDDDDDDLYSQFLELFLQDDMSWSDSDDENF